MGVKGISLARSLSWRLLAMGWEEERRREERLQRSEEEARLTLREAYGGGRREGRGGSHG